MRTALMKYVSRFKRHHGVVALVVAGAIGAGAGVWSLATPADAGTVTSGVEMAVPNEPVNDPGSRSHVDRSGRKQVGKASFYSARYAGKTMADGTPMRLYSNNAASLTLPLGTTAKVTNLETGRSAVITIRDRGPYVKGRIVDLSPATARLIGMSERKGVATVAVTPIAFARNDG